MYLIVSLFFLSLGKIFLFTGYKDWIYNLVLGLYFTTRTINKEVDNSLEDVTYVSNVILNDVVPVASVDSVFSNPYSTDSVKISRYYYNLEDDADKQKESIVFYNNTYMPNTGIDYTNEETFDVLAIMDGSVIEIKEDEMLGKIVEIRHDNNIISSYAGLSEISVQKGEQVTTGTKIGISGTSKINENLGNHLHLEIYKDGINIDPLKVIGKKLGDF